MATRKKTNTKKVSENTNIATVEAPVMPERKAEVSPIPTAASKGISLTTAPKIISGGKRGRVSKFADDINDILKVYDDNRSVLIGDKGQSLRELPCITYEKSLIEERCGSIDSAEAKAKFKAAFQQVFKAHLEGFDALVKPRFRWSGCGGLAIFFVER